MRERGQLPQVRPDLVALTGGLDLVTDPLFLKPGALRLAYNYEPAIGGGYRRVGGIERFDGRTAPNEAAYKVLDCVATPTGGPVGSTINGQTSGATGVVIYTSGSRIVVTKQTGTFQDGENLRVSTTVIGVLDEQDGTVSAELDNQLSALAASEYRLDITAVPGSGPVRGVAILNNTVYAWRNNAGGTALAVHKATTSGWVAVSMLYELSFTGGSTEPAEGSTLTQGGTTATVRRVVLESGDWGTANAAGRYILTAPAGGAFSAGAITTAGAGTVPAAGTGIYHGTQISLSPGGRVRAVATTFTGSASSKRLYGCDGINREFELGADDVLAPLNTGMSVRATAVEAHRNHLFFGFRGSLQHSGINAPYKWTVLSGASEIGAGDTITDLVSVKGSEDSAALMVMCQDAALVLYGDDAANFALKTITREAGCSARSGFDVGGLLALDTPGFVRYSPTQAFGNFVTNGVSQQIEPAARGQACQTAVWVKSLNKYRCFFTDGTAVCGMPRDKGRIEWTTIDYGVSITESVHGEISGEARTFYGDDQGYVFEADVGRSFAGQTITHAMRLHELHQRAPSYIKAYRYAEISAVGESAFSLSVAADFIDADAEIGQSAVVTLQQPGRGLMWDIASWDSSYWDVGDRGRKRFSLEGEGTSIAPIMAGESAEELPHTVTALMIYHSMRRIAR